ncbi:MAG: hypothetical protein JWN18_353 [Parcubacteria group bacterium]|nr:hypothetical protein [Parcubacteria group bacterium]
MSEGVPKQPEGITKSEYLCLAVGLSERAESFPFLGLDEKVYSKMKDDENNPNPDYPDTTTPIDERIERLHVHGMRVIIGKNPQTGMVYIMPADSVDIENDGLFPKHLAVREGMDPSLQQLVESNRKPFIKA